MADGSTRPERGGDRRGPDRRQGPAPFAGPDRREGDRRSGADRRAAEAARTAP